MTDTRPRPLDPGRPPLVEVALTIQFEPLHQLLAARIGQLWAESFRERFPRLEQHPPIGQVLELERAGFAQPRIQFTSDAVQPRFFFVSEDETKLVQLQPDRISFNWRMRKDVYDYPRYDEVRRSFLWAIDSLVRFATREKLGELSPNQCEILYANHILFSSDESLPHRHLGSLIKPWSADYNNLAGAALEDVRIHARHLLRVEERFAGRITLDVTPAYLKDEKTPIYNLQLVARGAPFTPDLDGALKFLDFGHERLLVAFRELVDETVQNRWMREYEQRH